LCVRRDRSRQQRDLIANADLAKSTQYISGHRSASRECSASLRCPTVVQEVRVLYSFAGTSLYATNTNSNPDRDADHSALLMKQRILPPLCQLDGKHRKEVFRLRLNVSRYVAAMYQCHRMSLKMLPGDRPTPKPPSNTRIVLHAAASSQDDSSGDGGTSHRHRDCIRDHWDCSESTSTCFA